MKFKAGESVRVTTRTPDNAITVEKAVTESVSGYVVGYLGSRVLSIMKSFAAAGCRFGKSWVSGTLIDALHKNVFQAQL